MAQNTFFYRKEGQSFSVCIFSGKSPKFVIVSFNRNTEFKTLVALNQFLVNSKLNIELGHLVKNSIGGYRFKIKLTNETTNNVRNSLHKFLTKKDFSLL